MWLTAGLAGLAGCPGNATTAVEERPSPSLPAADSLEVGDAIEVKVFGEPDLGGSFRVRSDGTVNLPLVGSVVVRGLTPEQASETLTAAYAKGYLKDPQVTVTATNLASKRFYVWGAVNSPGVFGYEPDLNILRAVMMAGGFAQGASKNSVVVTRNIKGAEVRTEVPVDDIGQGKARNFKVLPGDIIYVPTSIL